VILRTRRRVRYPPPVPTRRSSDLVAATGPGLPRGVKSRRKLAMDRYEFESDNTAAICPEAWAALAEANAEEAAAYGDDEWTQRRSEEHTSELQSRVEIVVRPLLEK